MFLLISASSITPFARMAVIVGESLTLKAWAGPNGKWRKTLASNVPGSSVCGQRETTSLSRDLRKSMHSCLCCCSIRVYQASSG